MARSVLKPAQFFHELRRRRVLRTSVLYGVGAYAVMEAADIFFPAWGLPDSALNILLWSALAGFPLALIFGWYFDITASGIVRTKPLEASDHDSMALRGKDYLVLALLSVVAAAIAVKTIGDIVAVPSPDETVEVATAPAPVVKLPRSIAVLPFVNVSTDPANEAFCDGVAEEILHRLSSYPDLTVIGRTSSFVFKDSKKSVAEISELLGVKYLLQGSVRKQGDNLRVTAQLLDDAGVQHWSTAVDKRLTDIFVIQGEIAEVVANTVLPSLATISTPAYEPNLEAYQFYLSGKHYLHRRDVMQARVDLSKAIKLDPDYAAAHAEYAIAMRVWSGPENDEQVKSSIERALELQPGMPRAKAALGLSLQATEPLRAEEILRAVLKEDSTMTDASNWLSGLLIDRGRYHEARQVLSDALRIDPLHPSVAANLAILLHQMGDSSRATTILRNLVQLPDPHAMIRADLAWMRAETGDLVDSLRGYRLIAEAPVAVSPTWANMKYARSCAKLALWDHVDSIAAEMRSPVPDVKSPAIVSWLELQYGSRALQGRYRDARVAFDEALAISSQSFSDYPALYGRLAALAGDFETASLLLEAAFAEAGGMGRVDMLYGELDARHALAYVRLQLGQSKAALALLDKLEKDIAARIADGVLANSGALFEASRNAVLAGNRELALARLKAAIEAGWREYYLHHHDPRWAPLQDDPSYQALMRRVKADVDRQRQVVLRDASEGNGV